jgi:hypothetical protein
MYVWILWRSEYEKWRKKKAWWERKGGGVDVDGKLCALFLLSFFLSFFFVEDDGSRGTTVCVSHP